MKVHRSDSDTRSILWSFPFTRKGRCTLSAFVMLEVLMSMTILAIAGTVLMRSIMNSMNASKMVHQTTKAVYLTQAKLHEFELSYHGQMREEASTGEFRGNYRPMGEPNFNWVATVEADPRRKAYIIEVWTIWGEEQRGRGRRYRSYNNRSDSFKLKTLVPMGSYNEDLVFGTQPGRRGNSRQQGSRSRRGRR